jgi:endogenous inhibitor of DNA gyrase (YacG/DUF329 family)
MMKHSKLIDCPNCGRTNNTHLHNECYACGTALDRDDDE